MMTNRCFFGIFAVFVELHFQPQIIATLLVSSVSLFCARDLDEQIISRSATVAVGVGGHTRHE